MPVPGTRRNLREDERLALLRILTAIPFDGSAELIAQAKTATAVETAVTDIDLEVDPSLPRAPVPDGTIPLLQGFVPGELGEDVMVWTIDGRLAGLEIGWVTDAMPLTFPDPNRITEICLVNRIGSA